MKQQVLQPELIEYKNPESLQPEVSPLSTTAAVVNDGSFQFSAGSVNGNATGSNSSIQGNITVGGNIALRVKLIGWTLAKGLSTLMMEARAKQIINGKDTDLKLNNSAISNGNVESGNAGILDVDVQNGSLISLTNQVVSNLTSVGNASTELSASVEDGEQLSSINLLSNTTGTEVLNQQSMASILNNFLTNGYLISGDVNGGSTAVTGENSRNTEISIKQGDTNSKLTGSTRADADGKSEIFDQSTMVIDQVNNVGNASDSRGFNAKDSTVDKVLSQQNLQLGNLTSGELQALSGVHINEKTDQIGLASLKISGNKTESAVFVDNTYRNGTSGLAESRVTAGGYGIASSLNGTAEMHLNVSGLVQKEGSLGANSADGQLSGIVKAEHALVNGSLLVNVDELQSTGFATLNATGYGKGASSARTNATLYLCDVTNGCRNHKAGTDVEADGENTVVTTETRIEDTGSMKITKTNSFATGDGKVGEQSITFSSFINSDGKEFAKYRKRRDTVRSRVRRWIMYVRRHG